MLTTQASLFLIIPMIRTLTTPVKLIDCLRTIGEYAFASSPYAVIITLEDHLNTALRAKLTSVCHLSINFFNLKGYQNVTKEHE